jgi:mannose-6-phosphate isomerase-like protein (cupin superfamily)
MNNREQGSCVVAREVGGRAVFEQLDTKVQQASGGISTSWFWTTDHAPRLPADIGAQPAGRTFPGPGGSKFGLVSLPAGSDGTMPAAGGPQALSPGMVMNDASSGMHATVSIDFEIVVSGRIVLELPGGESRTLGPGDSVVLAGVAHRWYNPFGEPCVYAAFILGAEAS